MNEIESQFRRVFIGWASQDMERWFSQEFEVSDAGWKPTGDTQTEPYGKAMVSVQEKLNGNGKARKPASGCNGATVYRWLHIRWSGLPMPIRIWRWWFTKGHPRPKSHKGCGCVVKLKAAWTIFRQGFAQWRRV